MTLHTFTLKPIYQGATFYTLQFEGYRLDKILKVIVTTASQGHIMILHNYTLNQYPCQVYQLTIPYGFQDIA